MSIPRTAIERPITMFMLCGVIMLLGAISLAKLPVDLMPDVTFPSITIRVGYPGVGPLEIEELITRPLEQAVSAVAGLRADQLHLLRRHQHRSVELLVGHRPECRGRRRSQPYRSDPRPTARGGGRSDIFKFDSTSLPIMQHRRGG